MHSLPARVGLGLIAGRDEALDAAYAWITNPQ